MPSPLSYRGNMNLSNLKSTLKDLEDSFNFTNAPGQSVELSRLLTQISKGGKLNMKVGMGKAKMG